MSGDGAWRMDQIVKAPTQNNVNPDFQVGRRISPAPGTNTAGTYGFSCLLKKYAGQIFLYSEKQYDFFSECSRHRILVVAGLVIRVYFLPCKQGKDKDDNRNHK